MKAHIRYRYSCVRIFFLFIFPLYLNDCAFARIVISQLSYGSDDSHKDEYVEIYNQSLDEIIDISLWKIQYRSTRSMPWRTVAVIPEDTYLPPRSYYLIASKDYSSKAVPPDLIGSFGLGLSMEGSLRIIDFDGSVMDLVGYGAEPPEYEKKPVVGILGQVILRVDPRVDTNNNAKDFKSQSARTPKNLSGQTVKAPTVREAQREISGTPSMAFRQKAESREVVEEDKYLRMEALLSEAKSDYSSGKWLTAFEKTQIALQFSPGNTSVTEFQKKMVRDVKTRLEKSSLVGQDEFYGQAFLYYAKEDLQAAQNALRKILVLNPKHAEARQFYDKLQSATAKPKKETPAAKEDEIIITIEDTSEPPPKKVKRPPTKPAPAPEASKEDTSFKYSDEKADELYDKGLREFAEGRLTEAIKLWEQTLKFNPNHVRAQKALNRARKRIQGD